jgi:hypothetical protein
LSGCARNLRKECAGLVAGQAVLTAEIRTAGWNEHVRFADLPRVSPSNERARMSTHEAL